MYDLYISYAIENGYRQVSDASYYKQLEKMNIGFHQPRKDQCWCARFCNLTDEEKAEQQDKYDLHIQRKDAARDHKKIDTETAKQSTTVITAVFDLEATLYAPFFKTKDLFYHRKLAIHNFTIFDVGKNEGKLINKKFFLNQQNFFLTPKRLRFFDRFLWLKRIHLVDFMEI